MRYGLEILAWRIYNLAKVTIDSKMRELKQIYPNISDDELYRMASREIREQEKRLRDQKKKTRY
jgi:hypothetical protein